MDNRITEIPQQARPWYGCILNWLSSAAVNGFLSHVVGVDFFDGRVLQRCPESGSSFQGLIRLRQNAVKLSSFLLLLSDARKLGLSFAGVRIKKRRWSTTPRLLV